jgi:hypothetical protein
MALPVNVRINTATPFPTMVTGVNGIGVGKNNGIWTVALNIPSLAPASPPAANFANVFVPVFVTGTPSTYGQMPLSAIAAGVPVAAAGSQGQVQYNNTGVLGGLPSGTAGQVLTSAGAGAAPTWQAAAPALPGYIGGLTLGNSGTTSITIGLGGATSDDNNPANMVAMVLPGTAAWTKSCNAIWSSGSGGNALDVAGPIPANAWMHVFLIMNTTSGAVDILVSTSPTTPSLPSGFNKQRRIGSIKTVSSAILAFSQFGDQFLLNTAVDDAGTSGSTGISIPTNTLTTLTLSYVPSGVQTIALFRMLMNGGTANSLGLIGPMGQVPGFQTPLGNNNMMSPSTVNSNVSLDYQIRINTSQQIQVQTSTTFTLWIVTVGWLDNRGK